MQRALKIAGTLALVAVCGAAGVWGTTEFMSRGESDQSGDRQRSATPVGVTSAETRTLENSVSAVGTILAARSIDLRPLAQGRVEEVAVQSGASVDAGDLILRLDDRAARARLAEAEATLAETRSDFERFSELADENVAADTRLEAARGAYRRAEAAVALAEAALEDRRLSAPFAGAIGILDTDPGEYVDPSTAISTLDDLSTVQADFALPERYFDTTTPGQVVRVTSGVYPDRVFEGEVSVKSPRIDPGSRSFDVRVRIDNPDRRLTSGMFVTAELVFDSYEALTLPDDAIISEGDATYVFTVEDAAARRAEIEVGSSGDGSTEIASGLSADARVVVTGWGNLTDGAPVEVAEDAPPPDALN